MINGVKENSEDVKNTVTIKARNIRSSDSRSQEMEKSWLKY